MHNVWITTSFPLPAPSLYPRTQLFEGYDNAVKEEVIIPGRRDGRGRIIPVRGINLLFRDIHSNAAAGFKKRLLERPVTPFHSCATLFPTRLRISLSLSLPYFIMTFPRPLSLFFLLILSPLSRCSRRIVGCCFNVSQEIKTLERMMRLCD